MSAAPTSPFSLNRIVGDSIRGETWLCVVLLLSMTALAVFEALTVGLVAPLLSAQSGESAFSSIPILGHLERTFALDSRSQKVAFIALALGGVLLLRAAAQATNLRLQSTLSARTSARLSALSVSTFLRASYPFASGGKSTDHVFAFQQYCDQTAQLVVALARMTGAAIILAAYLGLMLLLATGVTAVAIVVLGGVFLLLRWALSRRLILTTSEFNVRVRERNAYSMQSVQGTRLVRLLSVEDTVAEGIRGRVRTALALRVRREFLAGAFSIATPAIAGLFVCLVLVVIAQANTGNDDDWLSPLIMFVIVMFRLLGPLTDAVHSFGQISSARPSAESLVNYLNTATGTITARQGSEAYPSFEKLDFEDVSFTYPGGDREALHDISFSLRRGERVALVGPSGGGKSTIVNLLTGLYEPDRGEVRVNGHSLARADLGQLRSTIAMVDQDPFFFNASIRENLLLARPQASEDGLWVALDAADAADFCRAMPAGLDTGIGERGVQLSGGQRQRLALARAFLQEAKLLILDEATSQLDSLAQNFVQQSLSALDEDSTIIVIAHRLSTVMQMDRVLVVSQGEVVESGTPRALSRSGGLFEHMLQHQGLGITDAH